MKKVGIIPAFLIAAALSNPLFAKDAPEAELLREGRVYEAALLLQKYPKDAAAQKRAADLYYQLALYERAVDRLIASGMDKDSAVSAAVAEAFSQGNRLAALYVAEAGGLGASAKAEFARRELAEGRAGKALVLARESGDDALIARAGRSAYDEAVESGPVLASYRSASPRKLRFSPDGRFILLWNEAKTEIEILDTRLSPARPAKERGRIIDKSIAAGGIAMNSAGRFLAIVGLVKDKSGKESLALRLERLDTGFVARSLILSGKLPRGQATALAFAGDQLCVAIGRSLAIFDPWSGSVKAAAVASEAVSSIEYIESKHALACWMPAAGAYGVFDAATLQASKLQLSESERPLERDGLGGAGVVYDETRGLRINVPSSSAEDLRVESLDDRSVSRSGPLSRPLADARELRYSGGVDAALSPDGRTLAILAREGVVLAPFPFLEREEAAALLAKEFGATERFAPLCGRLVDEGRLDEAERLWTLAGVDEKMIFSLFAESKLRLGAPRDAAGYLLRAGQAERALAVADGLIEAAKSGTEVASAYDTAKQVYDEAGSSAEPLALRAARKAESLGDPAAAVGYYAAAGARGDVERLAFDPNLATVEWCLEAGSRLGLSEAVILTRAASVLESARKWSEAAEAYFRLRNDEALGRVAKAALSGSDWDHRLLDVLKARADAAFCRAAAESLIGKGEFLYAAEQYAAVNDLAGAARVADKALEADDFVFAAQLYASLGSKTAKAATAARLKLVYEEALSALEAADEYLAQETSDGINTGRIAALWPVPAAKAQDAAYQQMKRLGDALAALPSTPRSSEVKRCSAYLSKEAIKESGAQGPERANRMLILAARFSVAARILAAMGR